MGIVTTRARAVGAAMVALIATPAAQAETATVEFCLRGQLDLGVRLQGMQPKAGEFGETGWCVITEDGSGRAQFRGWGPSNPDLAGDFTVSYLPPDTVRIVNGDEPPDLQFDGAAAAAEALRNRRIDPQRLVAEIGAHPQWVVSAADGWQTVRYPGEAAAVQLAIADGRLEELRTTADLPLRGSVPVRWRWDWSGENQPEVTVEIDGQVLFRARGQWRELSPDEAVATWQPSGGLPPRKVPGSAWPARVDMQLERLAEGTYVVRGVRTGFHHMVIDTGEGLVVSDAPAGWVELHQVPPADLVPGLGISGLSERFVDFLAEELPGRPLRAVAVTHAHDDHAGGARAFAAAGADIYAPAEVSAFLEKALNREHMPDDRLAAANGRVDVLPVSATVSLPGERAVRFLNIGRGPHVAASLGVWAVDAGYFFQSDLHVPTSDADTPREDRKRTECWFAHWAVEHLPPETVVLGSHGTVSSPVSRLARYLESAACKADSPSP